MTTLVLYTCHRYSLSTVLSHPFLRLDMNRINFSYDSKILSQKRSSFHTHIHTRSEFEINFNVLNFIRRRFMASVASTYVVVLLNCHHRQYHHRVWILCGSYSYESEWNLFFFFTSLFPSVA